MRSSKDQGAKIVVATSASRLAVDVVNIRLAIQMNELLSILDYVQESGGGQEEPVIIV